MSVSPIDCQLSRSRPGHGRTDHALGLVALCVVLAIFFQAVGFVWGELVQVVGSFRAYLDHKLMDLPNDPAAKALLLEKGRDLGREFGEKYLMIRTSKRQTG